MAAFPAYGPGSLTARLAGLFDRQLEAWPETAARYAALERCATRVVGVGGAGIILQHNPDRVRSTAARVDAASVASRPCFLCAANRPPGQLALQWGEYDILVNPYPILAPHFTIVLRSHSPQAVRGRLGDMERLANEAEGMAVFYNGPRCGASAPDHMHFQAVPAEALPLARWLAEDRPLPYRVDVFESAREVERCLGQGPEPMVNLLAWTASGRSIFAAVPRLRLRPSFYGTGPGQMLISPASLDLAGVVVTPREQDFKALDAEILEKTYNELCLPPEAGARQ